MTATITAFADPLDRGAGLARDMIVRWALEEAGEPYAVRLVPWADFGSPAHRKLQPFGQIPTYEDGDLVLFESGAIVLHIAERSPVLFPPDANGRARAIAWMFAAVSSVEPVIVQRETVKYAERDRSWAGDRMAMVEARMAARLGDLSARLGAAPWLDGAFSAGDLLMVQALRRLEGTDLLSTHSNLAAYVERAKARPAFQRAFAAQRAVFEASLRPAG